MIRLENLKYKAKKVKMKDTPPIIMVVNSQNKMDILKSVPLSIHEKYFHVNSEAYDILQDEECPLEYPVISYFMGDA
jgi:hypothetical protein